MRVRPHFPGNFAPDGNADSILSQNSLTLRISMQRTALNLLRSSSLNQLTYIKGDPILKNLERDPRYAAFLKDAPPTGPISSIFDYTTFFVMLRIFHCWDPSRASLFQTGWFVESLMTQTLIIHVIRTNKIPFLQSRASWALTATTVSIMAVGVLLPYSPLASALGFTHLPRLYWPILMLTLLSYMGLTQITKVWLLRRHWI
jgi:hypothetical protein